MISLHDQIQSQLSSFGSRLQQLRTRRGWTLRDLADRSGFSKAFLSRLESGDRQASISAVLTLARIFDVSLASLFEPEAAAEPCIIIRRADAVERKANGLAYEPLSRAGHLFNLQPLRVRVSRSRRGTQHYHHEGEEWIYILSGSLTLSLAGNTYDLEQGDAAHFDSRLPHRLIARGSKDPELLVVASPLSQSAPVSRASVSDLRAIPRLGLIDFSGSNTGARTTYPRKHQAEANPQLKPTKSRTNQMT
jgi:transcriptional regulator with XRE-family HTH domain